MTDVIISNAPINVTLTRDCVGQDITRTCSTIEITNSGSDPVISQDCPPTVQLATTCPSIEVSSGGNVIKISQVTDGQGVPTGGEARQVLRKINTTDYNTEWAHTWQDYATNVEYTGAQTSIASGTVYTATIDGGTVYRFVNGTNSANGYPLEDSFYRQFSGGTLSDLIVTRG